MILESISLLLITAAGAYIQAVTGFALGLVTVGAVTLTGLVPVAEAAALATVAALVNAPTALRGHLHQIRWRDAGLVLLGNVPAVIAGVVLLAYLSAELAEALHTLLALTIVTGGSLLMLNPYPRPTAAGAPSYLAVGAAGGLLTGLFAAGGPPLVFHMYRQPFPVAVVRATLLATFGIANLVRLAWIGPDGLFIAGSWLTVVAAIPVVIGASVLGRKLPPPLSPRGTRRLAFGLLIVLGVMLLLG